jgi:hypothetical protein
MNHAQAARQALGLHTAALFLHGESQRILSVIPLGESTDDNALRLTIDLLGYGTGSIILLSFSLEVIIKAISARAPSDARIDRQPPPSSLFMPQGWSGRLLIARATTAPWRRR